MKLYRQGDVLFKQVNLVPKGKSRKRKNGHILEGEATGHVHRIANLRVAEVLEIGDGLYVSVNNESGVAIVHEEHEPLILPAGTYEVVRQREYAPDEIRNVTD